jgi:hemerythrin
MSVQWDPALALGHADIDGQHREIFRRLGALCAAMESGKSSEIGTLFDFLGEYIVQHFAAEERVMAESGYPGANVHRAAHARFVREYRDLRAFLEEQGPVAALCVKTRTWIEGWLHAHIAGIDQTLVRHLRPVTKSTTSAPCAVR